MLQLWFVVDVDPLNVALGRHLHCPADQLAANPLLLEARMHGGVQQKGVNATIPGQIDIADQFGLRKGRQVAQTVSPLDLEVSMPVRWPGRRE